MVVQALLSHFMANNLIITEINMSSIKQLASWLFLIGLVFTSDFYAAHKYQPPILGQVSFNQPLSYSTRDEQPSSVTFNVVTSRTPSFIQHAALTATYQANATASKEAFLAIANKTTDMHLQNIVQQHKIKVQHLPNVMLHASNAKISSKLRVGGR